MVRASERRQSIDVNFFPARSARQPLSTLPVPVWPVLSYKLTALGLTESLFDLWPDFELFLFGPILICIALPQYLNRT